MANTVEYKIKISDISGNVLGNVIAQLDGVDNVIAQMTESVAKSQTAFRESANEAFRFNQVKEVISGVSDLLGGMVAPAQQFEQAMREANTMAQKGEADYDNLKRSIKGLSYEIPIARDLLAKGLYQVISNGVPEDNWISFLEQSSKSAVGGLANLEKVVTVTSTVIKNYGLEWDKVQEIQDKIQLTANKGVTSFEQMAEALPKVSGNAATLGVEVNDLMATFATLTGVSGNTAEVATQLSAIFTAMIKPTSEASEMAKQMGISFDAASVKMAGGLLPFLQGLNEKVEQHANKTGMLKESIYGMLFSSAEALRAITPLTGALASSFETNAQVMVNSAGAVDAAFAQMEGTSQSTQQIIDNLTGALSDFVNGLIGSYTPYIAFVAQTGIAITQMKALWGVLKTMTFKSVIASVMSLTSAIVGKTAAMGIAKGVTVLYGSSIMNLTVILGSAKLAAIAFWSALTLGIGAIVYGVIELIRSLTSSVDENAEAMSQADSEQQSYKETLAGVKAEMSIAIAELKNFNGSKTDEASLVGKLNGKYGESFGVYSTVAQWYDTLTKKSEVYCKMIVNEAKIRTMADKVAKEEIKLQEMTPKTKTITINGKDTAIPDFDNAPQVNKEALNLGLKIQKDIVIAGNKELQKLVVENASIANSLKPIEVAISVPVIFEVIDDVETAIKAQRAKLNTAKSGQRAEINREIARLEGIKTKMLSEGLTSKTPNNPQKDKTPVQDPQTIDQLTTAINFYEDKLRKLNPTEIDQINTNKLLVAGFKEKKRSLEEIAGLSEVKATFSPVDLKSVNTLEELTKSIGFHEDKLTKVSTVERAEIQNRINGYKRLRDEWQYQLDMLNAPAGIEQLNTLDELANAISYYQQIQSKQSGQELLDTQKTINALQKKQNTIQQYLTLPAIEDEGNQLAGLGKVELGVELKLIGLDGIKNRIATLKKTLADPINPLGDEDKKGMQKSISQWESYANVVGDTGQKGAVTGAILGGLGSVMGNLSGVVGENGSVWLNYASNILAAVAQMLPALLAVAMGEGFAKSMGLPQPLSFIMLGVTAASVMAAFASIPKFADGGIAYGPTLGLFGEYSGASNNPEVVAPLNKLKSLIAPQDGAGGQVVFRIQGRELVGILNKMNKISSRTNG